MMTIEASSKGSNYLLIQPSTVHLSHEDKGECSKKVAARYRQTMSKDIPRGPLINCSS